MSDDPSIPSSAFERLVRSRWYGAGGIAGLSKVSGVSRATMYSWFRGETVPDVKSLARLASVLELPVEELLASVHQLPGQPPLPASAAQPAPSRMMMSANRPSTVERKPVLWAEADQPIGPVARSMYESHFSQVPVRDGDRWIGLLTMETIGRWMAGRGRHDLNVDDRAPIREVLAYADETRDFRVVPPETSPEEIVTHFDAAAARGHPLRAVLVEGRSPRTPLEAIVTAWDLPALRYGRR
ncbi:MAG TPA: helix-turn-helix domain-containing protein [Candidatus Limnocylindria bacterium]|nr:helix-turn-helix domain-containing protein [Candidatus Limnocylindria bacterium]